MTNKDWIQKMEIEELKDFLEGFIHVCVVTVTRSFVIETVAVEFGIG